MTASACSQRKSGMEKMKNKADGPMKTVKVLVLCALLWPAIAVSLAKALVRLVPVTKLPKD